MGYSLGGAAAVRATAIDERIHALIVESSFSSLSDAVDDSFMGEVEIGSGSWNTFRISSDGNYAYIVNWSASGSIAIVDLESMQLIKKYEGSGLF